jgi:hypothetical protein
MNSLLSLVDVSWDALYLGIGHGHFLPVPYNSLLLQHSVTSTDDICDK